MSEPKAYQLADAFHYLTREEVDALILVAQKLPQRPIAVNVGAGVGTSALALLETREDLTLFTVDIEWQVSPLGGLANERLALQEHGVETGERYCQIWADSATLDYIGPDPDLVVLDGDKMQIGKDLAAWWPRVKVGGYMAVHDYGAPLWWSIRKEVDKMLASGRLILLTDTLAVFQKEGAGETDPGQTG